MGKVIDITNKIGRQETPVPQWKDEPLGFADGARGVLDYLVSGADLYPEEAAALLHGADQIVDRLENIAILAATEAIDLGVHDEDDHPLNVIVDQCQYLIDFITVETRK